MPNLVTVQGTATAVHQKASSDCCGAKVTIDDPALPADQHTYGCSACQQSANRVLGDPALVPVAFGAEFPGADEQGGGAR